MGLTRDSTDYKAFRTLAKDLGIMCDGEAHIFSAGLLTAKSLKELTHLWEETIQKNRKLFDKYKGIDADKELEKPIEFQRQINKAIRSLGIKMELMQSEPNPQNLTSDLINRGGTANLTVKIMDKPPHGHVVTIWNKQNKYFIHDPNLADTMEVTMQLIEQIFSGIAELEKAHLLTYDFAFPIERVFKRGSI